MSSNLTPSAIITQQVWLTERKSRKIQMQGFNHLEIVRVELNHGSSHEITEVGFSLATRWLHK